MFGPCPNCALLAPFSPLGRHVAPALLPRLGACGRATFVGGSARGWPPLRANRPRLAKSPGASSGRPPCAAGSPSPASRRPEECRKPTPIFFFFRAVVRGPAAATMGAGPLSCGRGSAPCRGRLRWAAAGLVRRVEGCPSAVAGGRPGPLLRPAGLAPASAAPRPQSSGGGPAPNSARIRPPAPGPAWRSRRGRGTGCRASAVLRAPVVLHRHGSVGHRSP